MSWMTCLAMSRKLIESDEMWPDEVLEIEPARPIGGRVVWEWHAWDHLVQDRNATDDRIATMTNGIPTNGTFNFVDESANSSFDLSDRLENFPEPATFRIAFRIQPSASAYNASIR